MQKDAGIVSCNIAGGCGRNYTHRLCKRCTYGQITAPALVLHARDDTLVPIVQGMNTSAVIPGADSVIFETGGHFLLGETVAIRGQITTFLEQTTW